jgi:Tol biopolymer transport system component
LRPNEWNRLKLVVRDNAAVVTLNSQLIYERPLEAGNQRTFGLFHFADQTEARVRNIVMRGGWPESVPEISRQELAETERFPEQHFANLPAVFTHDFTADGLSNQYFNVTPANGNPVAARRDGTFASATAGGAWASLNQYARFVVHGDFDIEVAFEQLKIHGDKSAGVMLYTQLADKEKSQYRVMRSKDSRDREQIIMSESALKPGGSRSYDSHVGTICEGPAGRLRIARKGEELYYLFAENNSSTFHVMESLKASTADTTSDGIVFRVMCSGTASASVVWKQLTIRSDKLTWYPPPDAERPRKLLVMNDDGSELRAVADRPKGYKSLGSPEWSVNGKQIAFDIYKVSLNDSRSNVVNIDSGKLVDCGPGCMPSQSPDGKRIVFTQSRRGILMMDADGSNREDIDRSGWSAQWSPDGKYLAWGQGGNIIVMNLKTRKRTPILVGAQATMFSYTYWNPGWSHDSRSIAFKARNRRTGGEDIVVTDVDSPDGFQVLVASTKGVHPDFTFSPDNRRVMFSMNDPNDKTPRLYTVDRINADQPQQLAGQPRDWKIFNCDWHPSGKIAFSGEKVLQPVDWATAGTSMQNTK